MSILVKLAFVAILAALGFGAWLGTHEPPVSKQTSEIQLDSKNFLK